MGKGDSMVKGPFSFKLFVPFSNFLSRSTYDEYTPPTQVEVIQSHLLRLLGGVFGCEDIDIHKDYEDGSGK